MQDIILPPYFPPTTLTTGTRNEKSETSDFLKDYFNHKQHQGNFDLTRTINSAEEPQKSKTPPVLQNTTMHAATANHWPTEFQDAYDPIRKIGEGAFGTVVLGRSRQNPSVLVAIKLVGKTSNPSEVAYARRERDILMRLNHPNIVKCYQYIEPPTAASMHNIGMVLSYSKGPKLQDLLAHGGALSTACGRVLFCQIVDALNYLHSKDIIHRDIKPDNVIVKGADFLQNDIWKNANTHENGTPPAWSDLQRRWKAVLIDFGFARTLGQQHEDSNPNQHCPLSTIHESDNEYVTSYHDDCSSTSSSDEEPHLSNPETVTLPRSHRKDLHRSMTALGTKRYAAPEIFHKIQRTKPLEPARGSSNTSCRTEYDILGDYISSYSMLVDAYALGYMLRYMMTGVPPEQSIDSATSKERRPGKRVVRWISANILHTKSSINSATTTRHKHYRSLMELPDSIRQMIKSLTERDETRRMSIEEVRLQPSVVQVLSF